jgi:arylsulfatase A-like enzyme
MPSALRQTTCFLKGRFNSLFASFVIAATIFPISAPSRVAAADKPNVVFILTDDQRADHLGCAGHPFLTTPAIDRLAAEGAYFANMFVTTSLCSPSRASYLSGLYASAHGVSNNFTDYPKDLDSFPRRLQVDGYETAYIGKWHMGEKDDSPRPGFNYWASHRGQGDYFDNEFNVNGKRQMVEGYYTDSVTQLATNWLKSKRDKPFCLILGHKAPHTPFTPPPRYANIYQDEAVGYPRSAFDLTGKPKWVTERLDTWHGIYGPIYGFREEFPDRTAAAVVDFDKFAQSYTASIKAIDDSVAEVYRTLVQEELLDKTIFVFASDNGMFLGEHGMTDKRSMHEESIRVPLIVRYPKKIEAGTKIEQQVLNIDFAPSILELCGAAPLENIHGQSWVPLLAGDWQDWRRAWFYEYNYEKQFPYTPNVRGVRTDRLKYMRYPHGDGNADRHVSELYDIVNDPQERHNLIDNPRYAEDVQRLAAQLKELIKQAGGRSWEMPIDEGIKSALPDEDIR